MEWITGVGRESYAILQYMSEIVIPGKKDAERMAVIEAARAELVATYKTGGIALVDSPEKLEALGFNYNGQLLTSELLRTLPVEQRGVLLMAVQSQMAVNFSNGILGDPKE